MAHSGFRRVLSIFTPPTVIAIVCLVAAGAVAYVFLDGNDAPSVAQSAVEVGDITEHVSASGAVAPTESIQLGFERGGTIASIPVAVGEYVSQGEVLATLDASSLVAAKEQAAAGVAQAQAALSLLQSGTRLEVLENDRAAISLAIQSGYIAADAAVYSNVDSFILNPESAAPQLEFSVSDSALGNAFLTDRAEAGKSVAELQALEEQNATSTGSDADLMAAGEEAQEQLETIGSFLNTASDVLNDALPSHGTTAAQIAADQAAVSGARAAVAQAQETLESALGALRVAKEGATPQDIASKEAAIAGAQAGLAAAIANLAQASVTAPIAGTITEQSGNVGEVIGAGVPFISLNSAARFEIDAYVSEADIGKIAVGDEANVMLDAFPGAMFAAKVISINPAATVQNGVPSYEVKAQFDQEDSRIKAGLTANLTIDTKSAHDALLVPSAAVITQGDQSYVLLMKGGVQTLTPVEIGITDGNETQVVSGLAEGEEVASFGMSGQTGTSTQ